MNKTSLSLFLLIAPGLAKAATAGNSCTPSVVFDNSGLCTQVTQTLYGVQSGTATVPDGVVTRFDPVGKVEGAAIESQGDLQSFTRFNYTMIDPFDSVSSSFTKGSQGTLAKDTVDVIISTNSMKLNTSGSGLQTIMKKFLATPLDLSNKQFIVWLKVDGLANSSQGPFFYLSSDNMVANFRTCDLGHTAGGATYKYLQEGEWTPYTFTLSNCTTTGSPNISAINSYQVAIYDAGVASSTVTIHVNGFASFPSPAKAFVIVEEDNIDLTYISSGVAIAAQYGIPVQNNWTPENLGSAWMTLIQATQTAHNYMMPMGLHPGGTFFDTVSTQAVANLMAHDMSYYRSIGFAGRRGYCIYPHGAFNQAIQNVAQQQCAAARTIVNGDTNGFEFETFPPADPHRLRCYSVTNTDSLSKLTTMVSNAVTNKAVACFLFHRVLAAAPGISDVTPTTFRNFMQSLSTSPVILTTYPELLTRPYQVQELASITVSSTAYVGTYVSTQAAGGAGAAVTALCLSGTYLTGSGGCSCTGIVGATSIISIPNCVTQGCIATGWTCQVPGGTGGDCTAYATCSRGQ